MTMRIVILKPDKEKGLWPGEEHFINRIEALQMIESGKATTPGEYEKEVRKTAEKTAAAKVEADKKAAEEKRIADQAAADKLEKIAAEVLAAKNKKDETAASKRAKGRSRAVKK